MARKGHWLASVAMTVLVSPENEEAQVSALQSGSQLSLTPQVWGGVDPYCSFKLCSWGHQTTRHLPGTDSRPSHSVRQVGVAAASLSGVTWAMNWV